MYSGEGAFKVSNSWGDKFGDNGYWYLPYSLVAQAANQSSGNTYPWSHDENFVYVSALSHN